MTQQIGNLRVVPLIPGAKWGGIPGFFLLQKNACLAAAVAPSPPGVATKQKADPLHFFF